MDPSAEQEANVPEAGEAQEANVLEAGEVQEANVPEVGEAQEANVPEIGEAHETGEAGRTQENLWELPKNDPGQQSGGGCADVFEADTDKFGRTTFWLLPIGDGMGLEIEIEPARVFQPGDGHKVSWNLMGVVDAPDPQHLATLQTLAEKEQEHQALLEAEQRAREQSCLLEAPDPNPTDTKKVLDLPSGEYLCRRYAPTTFHGAPALFSSLFRQKRIESSRWTRKCQPFSKGRLRRSAVSRRCKRHTPHCFATWARSG